MNLEILSIVGKIAGIGGLAIGMIILIFKDIIAKNIFPTLTKTQAYSLLKLIIIFSFFIAIFGIFAGIYIHYLPTPQSQKEKIEMQLNACLNGDITNCKKIQSKFQTANIGCKKSIDDLKITMTSPNDGIYIFKQERYCGNMTASAESIIALLGTMYQACAQSLSSNECSTRQSQLRNVFNESNNIGFNGHSKTSVINYLTKYN
jgi:hypothetical protein